MHRARTDFPRTGHFPHLAPVIGALPIPGISRMPQGTTMAEEVIQPEVLAQGQPGVVPRPVQLAAPTAPLAEVLLGIGTASLSGAVTGAIAASSWRGAGIGASVNAGAWAGFTLLGGWSELERGPRLTLMATAIGGIATAAILVMTRD